MEKRYEEIYRKISTWDRFTNNLTSVIKLLIESVQTIVNYTLELCGKENKGASYARWLDTNNYQIDEFLKKVDVIEEEFHSGNLKVCQAELQRANHLRDEGRRLIKSLGRTPVPRPMLQCMTSLETIIKKLCTSSSAALGNRVEPVFILFIGPPGIGKSKVSRSIAHYLVAKSLHTEKEKELFVQDSNQYIYYRKIGNEHWEGYEPTMKAVIYDDISQMVDVAGGMYSEYLELIHLINSETYNLNMAFELKGKMFAGPDWVFGSTNSVTPNIQSINEHDAYYRRAKHSFYAVPKPEYTTEETKHEAFGKRKVDFSKLPIVGDVTDFGKDILEFHKVSYPSTGNYKFTGEVFNYEQICQYAMEQLEFNRKVYEKECADLKAERQRALDEYRQDTVPQSNVQFEHQDDIMQGIYDLPHVDYDDDAQEDYLPENWTEVEHNAVSNFLKSVERGNPKALQFMFILTKYYIAINTAMFQFVPTNEEVVTSYTVKFGEKFILLLTDLDIDILKDYCFKMVALGCTFDRRYRDICLPFKGYSYWKRVKSKFTNVKEHIWRKYIQGTFIEGLWVVMGYFAKQNEMYLWIMCGASIFQILLSYTTSKIISPVYEKIAHHSNEIALSLEVVHEISKRDPEEAQLIYEMLEMDSEFLAIMSDDSIDIMQKKDYILKSLQLKQYTRSLKPAEIQDLNEEVKQELRNEVEPQYGRKTSKTNRIKSKVVIKTNAVPQMSYGIDNNGNNIMRKVINSNSYELFIQEDHLEMGLKKVGSIVFVRGHIALHPEHYILQIQKIWRGCKKLGYDYGETFMELRQQNEYYTRAYKAKMKDIFDFKDNDLQAYYFPIPRCDDLVLSKIRMPNKGSSANIVKYFCTKNEFDVCSYETPGSLICVDGRAVKIAPVIAQRKHVNVDYKAAEENFSLVNTFSYNAPTEPGDCGGLLALNKPHLSTSRIYGMHVARSDDWQLSHAECPFREAIEVLLEHFDKEDVVIYDFDDNVTFTQAQCGIGQFQVLGQIDPKQPISSKSNIKKSVLFDRLPIPVTEVPARLAPVLFDGEVTDPWNHNIKKYCTNTAVYIDPKHVKMICQQMLIDLKNASFLNVDKDVLTMEEAVLGEDRFDLGSVPRNTSPGYPYTTEPVPGLPKRYRFFGNDPLTYDLDNPYYRKLEDRVAYVVEQAMNNTRCLHYSCDNLKDECIDIDKVLNKLKTRVYNNFPVDKLIVDKMYYGAFCSWLAKNKVDNNFAIGVNPYSEDWDAIARKLLCFGSTILRNIGSGDYSCFDGSEPFEIMDGIHEYIICAWYEDPDGNQVRKILFMDIVDSVHIRGGLVYKWEGGNTSGNFLTAPLNCLVNMFNFYYAWLRLHNFDYSSLKNFKRFISCIFLGDDNGFSVHPMYKELFTEFYLSEALKEIGFTYTSELKDTVNEKMRSITEIEFLKRKFIKDSALGRWMGALRIDSSMQGLYWTSKEPEKFTMVTKEKVDTVLKELSIHGREFFEYNAGFINYATEKYMNYISDFSTFELAYAAVLDSEYTY
jgi:DNA polymerase III delta prime subunit